jgi:hypothetical protein
VGQVAPSACSVACAPRLVLPHQRRVRESRTTTEHKRWYWAQRGPLHVGASLPMAKGE